MIVTEKELDTKWLLMFRNCKDVKRAKAEVLEHFNKDPMTNMSGQSRTSMNR